MGRYIGTILSFAVVFACLLATRWNQSGVEWEFLVGFTITSILFICLAGKTPPRPN